MFKKKKQQKTQVKVKVKGGPSVLKKIGQMMDTGPSNNVTKKFGM